MLATRLKASQTSVTTTPIQYVGGRTTSGAGTTSNVVISLTTLTGGLASAPSAGDLVIVYFGTGSTADRNLVVADYTEITELYANGSAYDTNFVVAYKFMGSVPDTTVTLTGGSLSTADAYTVAIQVWRNVDSSSPFDVTVNTSTLTNSVLANPPSQTSVSNFAVVVAAGAGGHDTGTRTYSSSNLSSFLSVGGDDTNDSTVGAGFASLGLPRAFDPAAFTFSGSTSASFSSAAATTILRPKNIVTTGFPEFVASANNGVSGSTLTINVPTGTLNGHLMLAILGTDTTAGRRWTPPSGWTEVVDQDASPNLAVMYKVAGSSEPASYNFLIGAEEETLGGSILTFKNAAYDTVGTVVANATNSSYTLTAITTSENYGLVLAIGTGMNATSTIQSNWSQSIGPNGADSNIHEYENFSVQIYNSVDGLYLSNAGSSGDATVTYSLTSGTPNSASVLLALKPA
jgi:hypothetical protein